VRFLTADKIFNGIQFIDPGSILVLDQRGVLEDILPAQSIERGRVEALEGTLTPGFINAHCHLELSHLRSHIKRNTGLVGFAMELMGKRNLMPADEIKEHIREADLEMAANGIVVVGDICNGLDTMRQKMESPIYYHSFVELIGLHPDRADQIFEKGLALFNAYRNEGLAASIVPHAPYSVSKELVEKISELDQNNGLPVSIHNQESEEEHLFFQGKPSTINALYEFLKLDISYFKAPEMSSVRFLEKSLKSKPRIFVHNTYTHAEDLEMASGEGTYWCFCPNANRYIENRLPEYSLFSESNFCIGTDSLASNDQLDMLSEINTINSVEHPFSESALLRALCFSGAAALGVQDKFGSLISKKNTGLNLLSVKNKEFHFIKKLA
jgi:cytosine/adenosine deaminase-related metal-dependent hydrolase